MRVRDNGVHVTEVDGTAVVLDTGSSTYLTLSGSGALLFEMLRTGEWTTADLTAALVGRYDVDEQRARADCEAFLASLSEHDLLER